MCTIRLLRKSENYCIKGTGYETIIKCITENYLDNKRKEKEYKKQEIYPKVKYRGIIYEYMGKEVIPTLGKEKIVLRVGKAIERIPLEKEPYLSFLEKPKEEELEIGKIVVFDSKFVQLESLLNEVYIEDNKEKHYLAQLSGAIRFAKTHTVQSQVIYTDKLEEMECIVHSLKCVKSIFFVIHTENEKNNIENFIKKKFKNEYQLIDLVPIKRKNVIVESQNEFEHEKKFNLNNIQVEFKNSDKPHNISNKHISKTRTSYKVTYKQEGYYSYFTEFYKADVFDRTTHTVKEKDAKKLRSGEYLIFLENTVTPGKDVVMHILEDLIKNTVLQDNYQKHYEKFYKWKEALEKYLGESRHSLEGLVSELKKQKVILSEQAVYQWLPEGRTIAPQTKKSFIALLNILGDRELIQQGESIYNSSIMIRKLHTRVKKILEIILLTNGSYKNIYFDQVEKIMFKHIKETNKYVKIVQIENIQQKIEMIPNNYANRLLNLK